MYHVLVQDVLTLDLHHLCSPGKLLYIQLYNLICWLNDCIVSNVYDVPISDLLGHSIYIHFGYICSHSSYNALPCPLITAKLYCDLALPTCCKIQ